MTPRRHIPALASQLPAEPDRARSIVRGAQSSTVLAPRAPSPTLDALFAGDLDEACAALHFALLRAASHAIHSARDNARAARLLDLALYFDTSA